MEATLLEFYHGAEALENEVKALRENGNGVQNAQLNPDRPLTLAEQARLMNERAKQNSKRDALLWKNVLKGMGIEGQALSRRELQRLYEEAGFDLNKNDFAQGIIDMREE